MGARNWTAHERREYAARAVTMHDRGASLAIIAQGIGCDRKTVPTLLEEEHARNSVAHALHHTRSIQVRMMIQRTAWQEYGRLPTEEFNKVMIDPETEQEQRIVIYANNHHIRIGLLNTISKEQDAIDRITGAATDPMANDPGRQSVDVNVNVNTPSTPQDAALADLLSEFDQRRSELDRADREADPRITVDTD